jgi:hypothetical protein
VSSVTNMSEMFKQAKNFNQDLTGWQVGQITKKRLRKVLQALRAQGKQCPESAQEMPQGLQMRCARIIRIIRVLMSDFGPSSFFFSVIWPSIIKSFIIKSFIIKSLIIKSSIM